MAIAITHYGCEPVTGKDGVFVADISGDYTLSAVSTACASDFASVITVAQDIFNLILIAETEGFADITGTIDEDDNITLEGSFNDGRSFTCDGNYTDNNIVSNCTISDDTSCAVTYQD